MKIEVKVNAKETIDSLKEDLNKMRRGLKLQMFRALSLLEAEILSNIRAKSGLKVRTGALLNSIGPSKKITEGSDGSITGEIGPVGVPYAAIHEFGGITSPHEIKPRVAKALAFQVGGKLVFANKVNHPGSKIPARPYLRPALAAKKDEIMEHFGLFLIASFKEKK